MLLDLNLAAALYALNVLLAYASRTYGKLDAGKQQVASEIGIIKIAKALRYSKLQALNLSGNQIENVGVIAIARALPDSKLQKLDLSENEVGVAGAIEIAKGKER